MRLILFVVLIGCLQPVSLLADEPTSFSCLMAPVAQSIHLKNSGFTWLPSGDFTGQCDNIATDGWTHKSSGPWNLYVHTDGPEGSGRFWTVTVGVSEKQELKPIRGVCFLTSTVGWRTLQGYSKGALPWLDDVNNDGRAEFILWASFPLKAEPSMADYALVAWVYRLHSPDSFQIDWDLSRDMARLLVKEYRFPLDASNGYLGKLRAQAAEALERFAEERCTADR